MTVFRQDNRIINFGLVAIMERLTEDPCQVNLILVSGKEVMIRGEEARAFWKSFATTALEAG